MTADRGRALSALLLDIGTEADHADWERQVPTRLLDILASLPPYIRAGLLAADVALDGASLLGTGRRAHRLPPDTRARLLRRLTRLPGFEVLMDNVKIPLLLAAGASRHSARRVQPLVRNDPPLDICPSSDWPGAHRADAVVIGSGAGGAVAALTLASAGRSVVVLEEGRHFPTQELASRAPLDRFADAYRDGGATLALGLPPVLLPLGRAVGGTTLVNSGTCFRTPRNVLKQWHRTHGVELADPATFARHMDHVEDLLGVGVPDPYVLGRNGALALLGSERLGWSAAALRRNATNCGGCCECIAGCPSGAKQAVHLSVLPAACAAGARIVTRARATEIVTAHRAGARRVTAVRAVRPDGTTFTVHTGLVVAAAGALHTPALLRRSGLAGHPRLGRNLAIHPAVSVAGRFAEPVTGPGAGPNVLQSVGVDAWHHDGILIEATAAPPGMTSFVLPHLGSRLKRELNDAGNLGLLGAMVSDRPSGRVRGTHRPVASYTLHAEDGHRLLQSIVHMGRILFAAGAREVLTGIPAHPSVTSPDALDDVVRRTSHRRLHLSAFHPSGTAALGADDQHSPTRPDGRLRGTEGVLVADACLLPSSPGVNPQITIMALAHAVTEHATRSWPRAPA
ncbi:GMC family oxidoreductase N-terminal domain-containing protein [Streptomyces sp. enrichment culture]|uniref:GMC family oxidoreductase N-terminal domain-containing protein n=1 Tax=Streptomyces sp. enrichment culture TaxID=1795815 RepID=UPI003F55AE5F